MSSVIHFLLYAWWFWLLLLVGYIFIEYSNRSFPHIYPKYDKDTSRTGDLTADGSAATSDVEKEILGAIKALGFRPLPPSIKLVTKDHTGKKRPLTPDIILWQQKLLIEVDPRFTHGGTKKIIEDIERNMAYTITGWRVLRIRIDWVNLKSGAEYPYARLHPNDMVVRGQFNAKKHSKELMYRIGHAREANIAPWRTEHKRLTAQHNTYLE